MPTVQEELNAIKAERDAMKKQRADEMKQFSQLQSDFKSLTKTLEKIPMPGSPNASEIYGAPWARRGADTLSSKGFSFLKMMGLMTGALDPAQCPDELDIHRRLHKCMVGDTAGNVGRADGYKYAVQAGMNGVGKFLAPLSTNFMMNSDVDKNFKEEMKAMVDASVSGAENGHMAWMAKSMLKNNPDPTTRTKALSWLNELTGGALVAPPQQGELIELLRNKEALVNAGARTVPLPPQGRMEFPRQTAASTTFWIGENSPIPASLIGTGTLQLQAKKLCVLIQCPNELIRFASPAAEALLRDDMTKSLALGLDLAGLQGTGTDTQPLGIVNMPNINVVPSSAPGANGDALVAQDIYRMIASVEEANAEFEGWIMRPKTLYRFYQLRNDAIAQGDNRGGFTFNLIREAQAGFPATLGGYPVTKSTQVNQFQTKGLAGQTVAGTTYPYLSYILGGMFSDVLIGMFGAIEFAATTLGDTAFINDQTWVRGILSADIQVRHQQALSVMNNLVVSG